MYESEKITLNVILSYFFACNFVLHFTKAFLPLIVLFYLIPPTRLQQGAESPFHISEI